MVHEGRVLLVKRGKEPLRGRWSVPGGSVELGESLAEAVVREVREETGISVRPREVMAVFDRVERDGPAVRYHFVIVEFLCELLGGTLAAGSDAEQAAFVAPGDLPAYDLPDKALEVVRDGLARARVVARALATPRHVC